MSQSVRPASFIISSDDAKQITGGVWHGPIGEICLFGATLDSRSVREGSLFACIAGNRVDGHEFAEIAVGNGAALVLASKQLQVSVPVLQVDDVAIALGQLAQEFRRRYLGATWIGITGSNGKTTVKEMQRAACAQAGLVHATTGNLNNHLGVPLSILSTPKKCEYVIIEMGANNPGEIDYLASITQPDIGIITSIGPAHLEGFGSLTGVAEAKGELFHHCKKACFLSASGMKELERANKIEAEKLIQLTCQKSQHPVMVIREENVSEDNLLISAVGACPPAMPGRHNVFNGQLVLTVCDYLQFDPAGSLQAVADAQPVAGRLRTYHFAEHVIFDDTYNANPASMAAGLRVLAQQIGARLAVLGAMGELGDRSEALHKSVGAEAACLGIPLITIDAPAIAAGYREAGGRDCEAFTNKDAALEHITDRLEVGPTAVLVKASRSARLEDIVSDLRKELEKNRTISGTFEVC